MKKTNKSNCFNEVVIHSHFSHMFKKIVATKVPMNNANLFFEAIARKRVNCSINLKVY
jgi:hypothetical protein